MSPFNGGYVFILRLNFEYIEFEKHSFLEFIVSQMKIDEFHIFLSFMSYWAVYNLAAATAAAASVEEFVKIYVAIKCEHGKMQTICVMILSLQLVDFFYPRIPIDFLLINFIIN